MLITSPEFYYGYEPMEGYSPIAPDEAAPTFYQGQDITITVNLGKPIAGYNLGYELKASPEMTLAAMVGMPVVINESTVKIAIPSSVTSALPGGAYYLIVKGKQKVGEGNGYQQSQVFSVSMLNIQALSLNPSTLPENTNSHEPQTPDIALA